MDTEVAGTPPLRRRVVTGEAGRDHDARVVGSASADDEPPAHGEDRVGSRQVGGVLRGERGRRDITVRQRLVDQVASARQIDGSGRARSRTTPVAQSASQDAPRAATRRVAKVPARALFVLHPLPAFRASRTGCASSGE